MRTVILRAGVAVVVISLGCDRPSGGGGGPRPSAAPSAPAAAEIAASPATCAALGGIEPGTPIGVLVVSSVSEPSDGAIVIRTQQGVVFEVRRAAQRPLPPATSGDWGVYFRSLGNDAGVSEQTAVAAANAIAQRIAAAPRDAPMPSGLTAPTSPEQSL